MINKLKQLVRKSKIAVIIYYIWNDYRTRWRFNSGDYETTNGSTHRKFTILESLNYINVVFDDYLKYSGLTINDIRGKSILEIGPGDNFGVAIKFLVHGAAKVVCLDKFFSYRNTNQQYQIYEALRNQLNSEQKQIFDEVVRLDENKRSFEFNEKRLKYVYGKGIEDSEGLFEPNSFDFIISRAVIEHLYDTDRAFYVMDKLLSKNGYLIHKIDFRDHGMFTGGGMHPLTFLTISDSLWKLMTYNSGGPNRKLVNYYKKKMDELGYEYKILITHILGIEHDIIPHKEKIEHGVDYSDLTISLVNKIRPKLQKDFRRLSDEELIITGIFLVAKKVDKREER